MARLDAPADLDKLFSVRVANIPPEVTDAQLREDFEAIGKIGDFFRPFNLAKHIPSRFAFIRYYNREDAETAVQSMAGKVYGDNIITVHHANEQDSYFTQDTGFITNQKFDVPKVIPPEFDSSLPEEHYMLKRKEYLRQTDVQYSLRIDDLPQEIGKEQLEEIFSRFGDVTSIYLPMDLKQRNKHRGFAFVRYGDEAVARRAEKEMDNTNLGCGRNIEVRMTAAKTYIGQDESPYGKYATHI